MSGVAALVVLFGFLWLAVSIWVGVDAAKNSTHDAVLWGLAVFVGGLLGLILYAILGRDAVGESHGPPGEAHTRRDLVECSNCRGLEEATRSVCRFCGKSLGGN